jgi:hypothetical protein
MQSRVRTAFHVDMGGSAAVNNGPKSLCPFSALQEGLHSLLCAPCRALKTNKIMARYAQFIFGQLPKHFNTYAPFAKHDGRLAARMGECEGNQPVPELSLREGPLILKPTQQGHL